MLYTTEVQASSITAAIQARKPLNFAGFSRAPHYLPVPVQTAAIRMDEVARWVCTMALDFLPPRLQRSVRQRQLEYIGGRLCAEDALSRLVLNPQPIGQRSSGEPHWQPGVTASISHTQRCAYAVAACCGEAYRIGIDSEKILADDTLVSVMRTCCTPFETERYLSSGNSSLVASIIFSSKESLYKVIGAAAGRIVDFVEVELATIDFDRQEIRFKRLAGDLPNIAQCCTGYFRVDADEVHTSVVWFEGM